jgi:hypothetical protein
VPASRSGTTNLAIIAGATIGAVGALLAGRPKAEPPSPAPTEIHASASVPAQPSVAPPVASSAPVWNADEGSPALTDAAIDARAAELDCSRGVSRMCLIAAVSERERDAGHARLLENLAVSQWSAACTSRDPEACHELAKLHERGIGVPVSAAHAKALRERSQDLCRQKPSTFCDTLQSEPP